MKMNPYQRREEEYRILTEKMQQVEKSYAISKARSIFDEKNSAYYGKGGELKSGDNLLPIPALRGLACLFLLFLFLLCSILVHAEEREQGVWVYENKEWSYHTKAGTPLTGWIKDKEDWYYISPQREKLLIGWLKDGEQWYFLNNREKNLGKMMKGWAVIDGYAYYFSENGSMAVNTKVDGQYPVNDQGQFLGANGQPTYFSKSTYRTKPSIVLDELLAKAEAELKENSVPRITALPNGTFQAHYGNTMMGIYVPGPVNPWQEKVEVDMEQYDLKEEDPIEVPDEEQPEDESENDNEEEEVDEEADVAK